MSSSASPTKVSPNVPWMFGAWHRILAFGFGSGLIRPAPGTWGTLLGWCLWVFGLQFLSHGSLIFVLLLGFGVGCIACQRTGKDLQSPDHGGMVWDEIIAIWCVLWLLPSSMWVQVAAFVVFRFFDILKPPPVRWADRRFKNGFGVMLDDMIAAAYTVLCLGLVLYFIG